MRRFGNRANDPPGGKILRLATRAEIIGPIRPHVSVTVNHETKRYIGYKEYVPGSLLITPASMLDSTYPDLLPSAVTEQFERAIFTARMSRTAQTLEYNLFGRDRFSRVTVFGRYAFFSVLDIARRHQRGDPFALS